MKKYLFIVVLLATACTNATKNSTNKSSALSPAAVHSVDTLKKLSDIKLTLLDARNEKAELLLGKPDIRGKIMLGYFYYMVYYNKVNDGGKVKHLLLLVDGKKGLNESSPIYKIVAVNDGETVERAGNFAQWLRVSNNGLTSNSMDFTYGKGTLGWSDIELGRGEITRSNNETNGVITTVNDLPIPQQAIKEGAKNKFTVKGVSGREIYLWYANNYHATLRSNEASDHKYLYMPFSGNDSCILLTMTGHIDGSILLEFSFECGD